jgi:carbon monoxide dehydrogenase subunit G
MDEAFDLLVDADAIAAALPGARPATAGATEGELDVDDGLTLRGQIHPGEHDRQAGAISFHVVGAEVDGTGEVTAGGAVRLREAGGMTAVAIQLEVDASGRLAAGGPGSVEATVRRLVEGLAAGLREHAEGEAIGYEWMTAGAPEEGDIPSNSLVPEERAAAVAAADAARPSPAWERREPRRVPGRVEIVTSAALPAAGIPVGDGPAARIRALHRGNPWLLPALLLAFLAVALLLRRRRAED